MSSAASLRVVNSSSVLRGSAAPALHPCFVVSRLCVGVGQRRKLCVRASFAVSQGRRGPPGRSIDPRNPRRIENNNIREVRDSLAWTRSKTRPAVVVILLSRYGRILGNTPWAVTVVTADEDAKISWFSSNHRMHHTAPCHHSRTILPLPSSCRTKRTQAVTPRKPMLNETKSCFKCLWAVIIPPHSKISMSHRRR